LDSTSFEKTRVLHITNMNEDNKSVDSAFISVLQARDVSEATWETWKHTENLWSVLNAIADEKIEKFEWDFIIKSLEKDDPVLSQDEADFLFAYLDKDDDGCITKPELKAKLNLVVRVNKWDKDNAPSKEEMIQCTYNYAMQDMKQNNSIDFSIQMAMITVKNSLIKLRHQIRSARKDYKAVNEAIDSSAAIFSDPQKIFDRHLKEHEETLEKYGNGNYLQTRYGEVKELLKVVQEEYSSVNAQMREFIEQGRELRMLKEHDERCCKVFGCLCPC